MARKLDIKTLVPRKNAATKQGYYKPINPAKYVGDPSKIIYRSSWEKKMCTFCDINEKVLAWSSETIQVPYVNPIENSTRAYNLDFYLKIVKEDGSIKEYIAEVKPAKKLIKPILPTTRVTEKRMNDHIIQSKEYIINMHKFDAAKKWAEARGWDFIIITEAFLF
jgi:hypothetical protein